MRVESPVGVELFAELHVWPFHSVTLTCEGRRNGWQDTTSCRADRFEDRALVLINSLSAGWRECQGGLSKHKSRQSSTGVQEAKRIRQVCCSWNIITYRLKVNASLHIENLCCGVKELGSWPMLPTTALEAMEPGKKWTHCTDLLTWLWPEPELMHSKNKGDVF